MHIIERTIGVIFVLIVLYLLFNSEYAGSVIQNLGGTASGLVGTLQGRTASFGNTGISVGPGPLSGASYGYQQ